MNWGRGISHFWTIAAAVAPLVTLLIYLARAIEQHAKDLDRE